ncbi:MAG: S41 family peptidase, partial [Myxococcota bacterium]
SGIGCTIAIEYQRESAGTFRRQLILESVVEGGPADRAGLRQGDRLLSVHDHGNDERTVLAGRDPSFASDHLVGEAGTALTLTVDREGARLAFDLERETIRTETGKVLSTPLRLEDGSGKLRDVGVVRLAGFYADCADDVIGAVDELTAAGAEAVVLDLRANSGGSKRDSDRIVAAFLERGSPVNVSVTPADPEPEEVVWDVDDTHFKTPLVIMVDGGSASASELVSGALQAHKRALIFGLPTFGKGSIQSFAPYTFQNQEGDLFNLGGAWVTGGKFFDPSGRSAHCGGVTPDVGVLDVSDPQRYGNRHGCEIPQVRLQLAFEPRERGLNVESALETFEARRAEDPELSELAGKLARGHAADQQDIALSLNGRRQQLEALEKARADEPESARRYNGMGAGEYRDAVAEDRWLKEAAVALFSALPRR